MVDSKYGEVFDAFGHTYPCWEFPYTQYNGEVHMISSIDNSTTRKNKSTTLLEIYDKIEKGDSKCSDCIFMPLCSGGCPLAQFEGRNACPSYKFNILQRLLLDYEMRKSRRLPRM